MGSLYKQAPMGKYHWIFCHLSLDILPFILASMPVEAWHPCKSIIGMRTFRFICMDFLYYGWLFEPAKFDGSPLPQKH